MNTNKVRKLARELGDIVERVVPDHRQALAAQAVLAYLRHLCYGLNDSLLLPYEEVVSREGLPADVRDACTAWCLEGCWDELQRLHGTFEDQDYVDLVEYIAQESAPSRNFLTPESVSRLVMSLFDVKNGDRIVDVGSASGNFISQVLASYPRATCVGYERDPVMALIFNVRIAVLAERNGQAPAAEVVQGDVFETAVADPAYNDQELRKVVFVDVPLGIRYRDMPAPAQEYAERLLARLHCTTRLYSAEWLYLGLGSRATGYKGRGACLMPTGCCFKANDLAIRKAFVEAGYIDCVIELPPMIVPKCSVSMVLVVIGRGKKGVKLIDARSCGHVGRQSSVLDADDIRRIVAEYKDGGIYVGTKDLEQTGYNLLASRYSSAAAPSKEGVPTVEGCVALGSFCKVSRGTTVSFKQVEGLITEEVTSVRYLLPNDIVDGSLSETMPYLDVRNVEGKVYVNGHSITTRLYCVKGHSLLMTRNGYPPRVAVVRETPAEDIIINGNIFMLAVDPSVADVDYVRMFLESARGLSAVKNSYLEALTSGIDQKSLQAIMVPLPDMATQRKLVARYEAAKAKVDSLKKRVEAAQAELASMVNEAF